MNNIADILPLSKTISHNNCECSIKDQVKPWIRTGSNWFAYKINKKWRRNKNKAGCLMAMLEKCQSFLDASKTGLGASRSAAAAGYDPDNTPLKLWGEIKGKAKKRRTDTTCLHGHIVEPGMKLFLLNALEPHGYTDKPLKTYSDDPHEPERIVCEKYPFMYFHPDAIFLRGSEEIVIEFKTALWTEHWNQEAGINYLNFDFEKFKAMPYAKEIDLPKKHYWQVQHQLVCNGSSEAILFAEVGLANNYIIYKIKLDENINMHIAKLADFWFHNLACNVMPDAMSDDDVMRLRNWGKIEDNILTATDEQDVLLKEYFDIKQKRKEEEKKEKIAAAKVKMLLNTKNRKIVGAKYTAYFGKKPKDPKRSETLNIKENK